MYKENIDELEIQATIDDQFCMINDDYMNFKKEYDELIQKYRI